MKLKFVIIAVFLALIWSLPIITGYLSETEDADLSKEFLGWMRSDDFHRYGSLIDQTRYENAFIYRDFSSVEPQSPRMIAVYFSALGLAGKVTGMRAETLWLVSRFVISLVFIFILVPFIGKWRKNQLNINIVLFFTLFSSGLEWLGVLAGFTVPRLKNSWMDGFSTFCSFHNPLKIAGITMVLLLFLITDNYLNTRNKWNLITISLLILLMWGIHPNSAIPGYTGILFLAFIAPRELQDNTKVSKILKDRWLLLLPLIIPVALIILYIQWMKTDPTTASIIQQYNLKFLCESFRNYPVRYGVVLPLAVPGVIWAVKKRNNLDIMLLGWLVGALFFSHYARMSGLLFQHMVHLPMALFAALAFNHIFSTHPTWRRVVIVVFAVMFFSSHVYEVVKVVRQTRDDIWPTSLYWTRGEVQAAEAFRRNPHGNVLVSRNSGNKVAWLSMKNVFLGHWGTTPQKGKKERLLQEFYNQGTSLERIEWILDEYDIRYIWYGPDERQMGPLPPIMNVAPVISNSAVTVFKLRK